MENQSATISRWLRVIIIILIYASLLVGGHWGSGWLIDLVGDNIGTNFQEHETHVMIGGVALFSILMAIPFMPGIEISLALIAVFGPKVAVAVYVATVAALMFSWLIGKTLPISLIISFFRMLGLRRAMEMTQKLQSLHAGQRFEILTNRLPKRGIPVLLRHRYIAIILALNIPGNAVIGGGSGIALLAGMSGLFTFLPFLFSLSLAALPIPLFVILTGY